MSADRQGAPIRQSRPLLAAGYVGAAAIILLVLIVPLPDVFQAVIYLLLFSVLPGGSLLIIFDRTPSNPLLTLIVSLVISVAFVMTTTLMMAYLELWAPVVIVVSIAVLSVIAGAVEFTRVTARKAGAELRSVGSSSTRSLRRSVTVPSSAPLSRGLSAMGLETPGVGPDDRPEGDSAVKRAVSAPDATAANHWKMGVAEGARLRQAPLEPMTAVLLVTDNVHFEEAVSFALDSEDELRWQTYSPGSGLAPSRIAAELSRIGAVMLVIGPDVPAGNAIELARHIRELASEVSIVVAGPIQAELFKEALTTGVTDVISSEWTLRMSSKWSVVLLKPR